MKSKWKYPSFDSFAQFVALRCHAWTR